MSHSKAYPKFSRPMLKALSALTAVALMAPAAGALAQQEPVTPERLNRIENAIRDLQGVVYSVEGNRVDPAQLQGRPALPGSESSSATLTVRVSQLEQELQRLTGQVEEMSYRFEQNHRRLDTLSEAVAIMNEQRSGGMGSQGGMGGDMTGMGQQQGQQQGQSAGTAPGPTALGNRRLSGDVTGEMDSGLDGQMTSQPLGQSGGQSGGDGLPSGVDSPFPTVDEGDIPDDPNLAYDTAYTSLVNGDYQEAEMGFAGFLQQFPDDPRAADAQYRLGEIYLATGANARAARAFLDHIRNWPDDARSAESYLKLGMSYARLDKTTEACQIFGAMDTKFPDMPPSMRDRLRLERDRAGC